MSAEPAPAPAPALALRSVTLALPGADGPLPVLDGVSLRVAPGEVVALVGPSGCGKSTLLDVAAGLLDPDAGRVELDGREAPGRLGLLALMPQGDALLPWRTVLGNVADAARLAGEDRAGATATARDLLGRYGLGGFEDHYPHALSGGMRQRVALARTVASRRRAWLLDEPFAALDALTRLALRAELAEVWGRHRPTVLLVTHDVGEAVALADRVLVCGPRPMGALEEVPVPLPRPRTAAAVAPLAERVMAALARAGALPGVPA